MFTLEEEEETEIDIAAREGRNDKKLMEELKRFTRFNCCVLELFKKSFNSSFQIIFYCMVKARSDRR